MIILQAIGLSILVAIPTALGTNYLMDRIIEKWDKRHK